MLDLNLYRSSIEICGGKDFFRDGEMHQKNGFQIWPADGLFKSGQALVFPEILTLGPSYWFRIRRLGTFLLFLSA